MLQIWQGILDVVCHYVGVATAPLCDLLVNRCMEIIESIL